MNTIAWKDIYRPLNLGAMGPKAVQDIANSAIIRQVWSLASKRTSIWNDWIYSKYVKDKSIWSIKIPSNCSWGLKGILGVIFAKIC